MTGGASLPPPRSADARAGLTSIRSFYDDLAPLYHLVYSDWEASVARQGEALASLITEHWGSEARFVLDAAAGIGTQAIGLLSRGFRVAASDLSPIAAARARREAAARNLPLAVVAADFRALPVRPATFDAALVCDNALPHLGSAAEIRTALAECLRAVRPGGGCLISMRDYGPPPPPGTVEVFPYGERIWQGRRYDLRQTWTWRGARYDLTFEFEPLDDSRRVPIVFESSYLAIPMVEVAALMRAAGFESVRRVDGRFFQPVLVGTRPAAGHRGAGTW